MDPWLLLMPLCLRTGKQMAGTHLWPKRRTQRFFQEEGEATLHSRHCLEHTRSRLPTAHAHTLIHTSHCSATGKGAGRTTRSPDAEPKPRRSCGAFQTLKLRVIWNKVIPCSDKFGQSDMTCLYPWKHIACKNDHKWGCRLWWVLESLFNRFQL